MVKLDQPNFTTIVLFFKIIFKEHLLSYFKNHLFYYYLLKKYRIINHTFKTTIFNTL